MFKGCGIAWDLLRGAGQRYGVVLIAAELRFGVGGTECDTLRAMGGGGGHCKNGPVKVKLYWRFVCQGTQGVCV